MSLVPLALSPGTRPGMATRYRALLVTAAGVVSAASLQFTAVEVSSPCPALVTCHLFFSIYSEGLTNGCPGGLGVNVSFSSLYCFCEYS